MIKKILKKFNTLLHLDLKWARHYYWKKFILYLDYYLSVLKNINFFEAQIDGLKIKFSFNHYYHHYLAKIIAQEKYEKHLLETWKKKSEGKGVIFDIGGYNGLFGLIAAAANSSSSVYIFEPDSINGDCILKNIELNNLKNIVLVPAESKDF